MNSFDFTPNRRDIFSHAVTTGPWNMHRLGLQVVISAHNAEPWIERCLASVELAMARHPWILIVVDDGSTDDTLKLIVNHPSQADRVIVRSYPKAANVSIAKNRAFALTLRHADRYPAILPMDADDEMTPERATHLLPFAVFGGHRCVFGDYRYVCPDNPERHDTVIQASPELIPEGKFGPPMTLFHQSLMPRNGRLFREDMEAFSDCALWHQWEQDGVNIVPAPGAVVHLYHFREGSTSNPDDKERLERNIEKYVGIRDAIRSGVEVIREEEPKVSAVMLTGKCTERYALARVAVQCFFDQTWGNRELVIVNHGDQSLVNGDPRIREVRIDRPDDMTLGEMRNLSLDQASGDYVIQWDDDDWHHPKRIETMMEWRDKGQVIALRWQTRINLLTGSVYYNECKTGQQMSILHHAGEPFRYPRMDCREDTVFMGQFSRKCVIDNAPHEPLGPMLYVRTFHAMNIWHEEHVMRHLAGTKGVREINGIDEPQMAEIEALYDKYIQQAKNTLNPMLVTTAV